MTADANRGDATLDRITVLLVEDDPDDAELAVLALQDAAAEVQVTLVDSEAAFISALGDLPDAIVSDLSLTNFDGR